MQTNFSPERLADPAIAEVDAILRSCVHCGFCTATCPTYLLLGDERDSPRGRIYQMKSFLEEDRAPTAGEVRHIDRCLSCLGCMTTCPASVHYMHLVDRGRAHIERRFVRPLPDRLTRAFIALVLPRPGLFRWMLRAGALARPFRALLPRRLRTMLDLLPAKLPRPGWAGRAAVFPAAGPTGESGGEPGGEPTGDPGGPATGRVALLAGCAQQVLGPQVNEACVRLLTRLGIETVIARPAGCCGALEHHMGRTGGRERARAMIAAWTAEADGAGLDAILVNASGCGTTIKDYGHMLRDDPVWAGRAARVAGLAQDMTEFLAAPEMAAKLAAVRAPEALAVTYHSACSMQHGQQIGTQPLALLRAAGFKVTEPAESHLCCGSAGTYNMLQPELAGRLKARKVANLRATAPDVVATGNIGCAMQLAGAVGVPVVHTVELLDWAAGGPKPAALRAARDPESP